MRTEPPYRMDDPEEVRRLVRRHPWATLVSATEAGLVASHYPVLLDEAADGLALFSHVGRPDEERHELGRHEVLVVVQGPQHYVSPSWYPPEQVVPTWNHVTVHLWGTPRLLGPEENWAALAALTDHLEAGRPGARRLAEDEAGTRALARGTVGFHLRVDRFEGRAKLSQDKAPEVVRSVVEHLDGLDPALAAEMRRHHGGR
ncbi:FMN-binding negative transcriptional regulator [Aquipuribacter sp. SD81]|uniref:FMN-binding negative transcriptional regulator n=1 Tax=Aquipuribacter sp. SD81 TaxID=3127703 RepID=UPI00301915DE